MRISAWSSDVCSSDLRLLCCPGAPFEVTVSQLFDQPTRTWKNAVPNLAALAEIGRANGSADFLVYRDERVTYEGWYRAAATLAQRLRALGIRKGDRVALAMRNLPEWPIAFFSITAIGAICVPLNAWWTGSELVYALCDSASGTLICDDERYERLKPHLDAVEELDRVIVTRATGDLGGAVALEELIGTSADYESLSPISLPAEQIDPDDEATILYTSGTTGFPKGAVNTHRNLTTHIQTTAYFAARALLLRGVAIPAVPAPPALLIAIPLFHVSGCAAGMMGAIAAGGKIVLMHKWDAERALQLIEEEKITFTGGVPTIAWQLVDHPARECYDLSSLVSVGYGGAPSAPDLVRLIHQHLGAMPGNGWGMTETTGTVLSHTAEEYMRAPTSCGRPVPVAEVQIMSADGESQARRGEVGELWARGPMVAKGYWRNPEATAATFVDGWVRTGDLARMDEDGYVYIVDRIKDMILRGGERAEEH